MDWGNSNSRLVNWLIFIVSSILAVIALLSILRVGFAFWLYSYIGQWVTVRLGLDYYEAELLTVVLTTAVMFVIPGLGSLIISRKQRLISAGLIIGGYVVMCGLVYTVGRNVYFNRVTGEALRYYADTPGGREFSFTPGFHPRYRIPYKPYTQAVVQEEIKQLEEKRRKAALEAARLEAEARKKQELEERRLQEEAHRRQEEEQRRVEAEARKQQEQEQQRLEAEAQARQELELRQREAEAQRQHALSLRQIEAEQQARELEQQRLDAEQHRREREQQRLDAQQRQRQREEQQRRDEERRRSEEEARRRKAETTRKVVDTIQQSIERIRRKPN